jgi:hypothetical protein
MRTPDNLLERQESGSYGSRRGRGESRMLRRWGSEMKSGGALALFGVYRGDAKAARGSEIAKNLNCVPETFMRHPVFMRSMLMVDSITRNSYSDNEAAVPLRLR